MDPYSPSGIPTVPYLSWGSHHTQFFGQGTELRDLLVPYFEAGLANNERCLWVTGEAFGADDARAALRSAVPDLDERERRRQIEIVDGTTWYSADQKLQPRELVTGLLEREQDALGQGYAGLRTNGNCAWVSSAQWADFLHYEALVHEAVRGRRMICLCSYCHDQLRGGAHASVMDRHDMVLRSPRATAPVASVVQPEAQAASPVPVANGPAVPVLERRDWLRAPPRLVEELLAVDQIVLDALPIGVYACDADGQILRVNRTAVELWGQAPRLQDPTQLFCGSFHLEGLDHRPIAAHETPMARAIQHGESFAGAEAVVRNPDGRRWVARVHVAPLRSSDGTVIGAINCFQDVTQEHELRDTLVRQQCTFDLAMVASRMGTWRYTFADNICIYDENAQRLYGLTGARFLHDEKGVAAKFHPDDVELMWSRVSRALDPRGDGRYEVEYRVRQLDGSWRWLSAWGLVEFEGAGEQRRPVAIAGASLDLTERKEAEELQQLLMNELHHRVKNTLATLQSIIVQTLRSVPDLPSARRALESRIVAMARAHDLLALGAGTDASLVEVIDKALSPFARAQVEIAGEPIQVSPKHAFALSLAMHELATNATKYGALSCLDGRVLLRWNTDRGALQLDWQEQAGPPVAPPSKQGYGTRLMRALIRNLNGTIGIEYEPSGLRCRITAEC